MRLCFIIISLLAFALPPSVIIQITAAQQGLFVVGHMQLLVLQSGAIHVDVQSDAGLADMTTEMDGGACLAAVCDRTVQSGSTVEMTATAHMQSAGQHFLIVIVTTPDLMSTSEGVVLQTSYYAYLTPLVSGQSPVEPAAHPMTGAAHPARP